MKTKKLLFFLTILLVLPLAYAENYGVEEYGCGLFGIGCSPSTPTPTPTPDSPSGGGDSSCSYDWECTNWFPSICPESEIQQRICANKGTCTGTAGMPNQTQTCEYLGPTGPLFDIYLTLSDKSKKICPGNKIKAEITLKNYGKIELLDAFMTYWILDENNSLIVEVKNTQAVESKTSFNVELEIPIETSEGIYKLYAEITYSGNKTAIAGETFGILPTEKCGIYFSGVNFILKNKIYFIIGGIGLMTILFIIILIILLKTIFKRKRVKLNET